MNTDNPEEKAIITYVAKYYEYFTSTHLKKGPGSVPAKRVGNVLNRLIDEDKRLERYEWSADELLKWIREKTDMLNERDLPNTVAGVQALQKAFHHFRNVEKPPKCVHRPHTRRHPIVACIVHVQYSFF